MQEQLGYAIGGRGSILLVLDNFEHVAEKAQHVVGYWMLKAPSAHFMITSRSRLGVQGERVYHLNPLNEVHSIRLFKACIESHGPYANLNLNDTAQPQIKEIVRRLDGIPLGIELVAGQLRDLGIQELFENFTKQNGSCSTGKAR